MNVRNLNAICTNYLAAPEQIAKWKENSIKANAIALVKIASYPIFFLPAFATAALTSKLIGRVSTNVPNTETQNKIINIRLSVLLQKDFSPQVNLPDNFKMDSEKTEIQKINFSRISLEDLDRTITHLSQNLKQGKAYFSKLSNDQLKTILRTLQTNNKTLTMGLLGQLLTKNQINNLSNSYPVLKK